MKRILYAQVIFYVMIAMSCNNSKDKDQHTQHQEMVKQDIYTCSMHPEIIRDKSGKCPICGMDLVKKESAHEEKGDDEMRQLLKPTNEFIISSIPVITIHKKQEQIDIEALGNIAYDTRRSGIISSRVAGRIEKLYVRFRYQRVNKGQHILDIYSPELMTAQQNLLFLLKNDSANTTFIQAAREKLLLLGMSDSQLQQVVQSGKPALTVAVYSNYSGHIHEAASPGAMNTESAAMTDISLITDDLSLKEGMYLQKGQSIFTVYNPDRAWVILNIYPENQALVKTGNSVSITPETRPKNGFRATIDFIEPLYRKESKTVTARVYFDNSVLKIPVGSQVRATISGNIKNAYWLPKEAVVSLGMDRIVFLKSGGGFKAHKINTGITHNNHIQVLTDITISDSVAANAQYLMDSESFIKLKK